MGDVAVTVRIMPEDASTDLEGMKSRIRKALGTALRDLEEQDVAFGLRALMAMVVVSDAAGGTDRLEQSLAAVPGVGSVETVDVTLI
jgi:translation elongation factor aEF-1 beta